ncbi:MAG: PQQ-dependent sugar dehydrogenase [Fibrobacteres bacterium]|nr:PQQ-dependent sugar dehydrogenase [Fibrobacterota bacterium]
MGRNGKWALAALVSAGVGFGTARGQDKFSAPNCTDVTEANFNKVSVLDKTKDPNLDEVTRFAVAKDGSIYFSERGGSIKMLSADGATVTKLGKINSFPTTSPLHMSMNNVNNEFGLVGFTIDPNFETNHWLYVDYQMAAVDSSHLSRFTVTGNQLDMGSEKVILSWPTQKNYCCHTGGDIRIDGKGDLWISVGNNTLNPASGDADSNAYIDTRYPDADDEGHSANSNDLRGKILRIHPTADGGYTVPPGNLKDYYASMYSPAELAKIRPEIYTMGHRNPYTISVDDAKGLLTWGDVGPDMGWQTEELNLVTHPGFMGWPYFAGAEGNPHYQYKAAPVKDPAAPMNTGIHNTGVQKLPPAQGAIYGYTQAAAITGPIYRYNPAQTSTKKLPGQFDGVWFVTDWKNAGTIYAHTLNADNTKVLNRTRFYTGANGGFIHPLEIYIGPDGVMYVLDYYNLYNFTSNGSMPVPFSSTPPKIFRLDYTGAPCAPAVSIHKDMASPFQSGKSGLIHLGWDSERQIEVPLGYRGFTLYDLQGKTIWSAQASQRQDAYSQFISVPAGIGSGLFKIKYSL